MANLRFAALVANLLVLAFPALALPALAISRSNSAAQKIQWVNCTAHVPETLQTSTLPATLPTNLHCGLLTVPMDYSKPISTSNNITLGFAMRRPSNPQGLLN